MIGRGNARRLGNVAPHVRQRFAHSGMGDVGGSNACIGECSLYCGAITALCRGFTNEAFFTCIRRWVFARGVDINQIMAQAGITNKLSATGIAKP